MAECNCSMGNGEAVAKGVLGAVRIGSDFVPDGNFSGSACDCEVVCKKVLGHIRITAEYLCSGDGGGDLPPEERVTIRLSETSKSLATDGAFQLQAIVGPADLADKSVIWTSSDETVATVDQDGNVTAVGVGTVTITATTTVGGKTASCVVNVKGDGGYPYIGLGDVAFNVLGYDDYGYDWTPEVGLDGDLSKQIAWGGKYEGSIGFGYDFPRNYLAFTLEEDGYLQVYGCGQYVGNSVHIFADMTMASKIESVPTNGYNWTKFSTKLEAGKTYYLGGSGGSACSFITQFKFTRN